MTRLRTLKMEADECAAIISDTSASVAAIRAANQRLAELKYEIAEAQIESWEKEIEALSLSSLDARIVQAQADLKTAWQVYDEAEAAKHKASSEVGYLQGKQVYRWEQIRQLQQRIAAVKANLAQTAAVV